MGQYIQKIELTLQNDPDSIKNIETQIGQLSNTLTKCDAGTLPSNTILDLKEQIHAIVLRSGKQVGGPKKKEEAKTCMEKQDQELAKRSKGESM